MTDLIFTDAELDLIGRTADALTAYTGRAVLAELIDPAETGFAWVVFGAPLAQGEREEGLTTVQIGGPGARLLGSKAGLDAKDTDAYQCQYLWAIQRSDLPGVRFIKVDGQGEECGWSDDLASLLPFDLAEPPAPSDDDDEPDEPPMR